jgi:hypothetical protein
VVCNILILWLHSTNAACSTYVTVLVCVYYVRTSWLYLFILMYFRHALVYHVRIILLFFFFFKKRIYVFFTARFYRLWCSNVTWLIRYNHLRIFIKDGVLQPLVGLWAY